MDYEENDFQSENHHLAGEGSTKFPSSLRPYALPKFDFDESHLRFDSLVETEVFLGIESNEGNRWIEDFSRGSGGIEFSTSAGESCSITRRNNVWSEATSSESVEMLLKSVGQEEFIPKEAIVEVSDAGDELGCMNKQMEPDLGHNGSIVSDQGALSMPEVSLPVERDSADTIQTDACNLVDKSPANMAQDDLSNPGMLVHNLTESLSELKKQEADDLPVKDKDDSQINSDLPGEELPVLGHVVKANEQEFNNNGVEGFSHHLDQPSLLVSNSEHVIEENIVAAASAARLDPPNVVLKGDFDFKRNSEIITAPSPHNNRHENVVTIKDSLVSDKPIVDVHSASMDGREIGAQGLEATDKKTENSFSSGLSVDQSDSVAYKGNQLRKVHQLSGLLADNSLASPVSVKEFSRVDDGSINRDASGASSNIVLCSSDEVLKKQSTKVIEGLGAEVSGNDIETQKRVIVDTRVEKDHKQDIANESELALPAGQEEGTKLVLDSRSKDDVGDGAASVLGMVPCDKSGSTSSPPGGKQDVVIDHTEVQKSSEAVLPLSELDGKVETGVLRTTRDSAMQLSSSISAPEQDPLSGSVVPKSSSNSQLSETKVALEGNTNVEATPHFPDTSEEGGFVGAATHSGNQGELPPDRDDKKESEVAVEESNPANPGKHHGSPLVTQSTGHSFGGSEKVKVKGSSSKKTQALNAERNGTHAEPEIVDSKQNNASKDGNKSETMEVVPPLTGSAQPASLVEASNTPGSPRIVGGNMRSGYKSTPERKIRRSTGKATGKESGRKGSSTKEAGSSRRPETMGKSSNLSVGSSGLGHQVQTSEAMQHGTITAKPFGVHVTPTSTSTSSEFNYSAFPMVFQQPFTDMQQLQLRAQIFVYGSLISKQAPEESHMVSAFGGSDGSRSLWEKVWRACKERIHSHILHSSTPETPLLSRSGDMHSDQAVKQSGLQNKVSSPPASRASSKGTLSPVANPMIPLSSPLWSIPTPSFDALQSSGLPRGPAMDYQRAFPPLQPHQTPPVVNFVGHSSSWISPPPFHAPWTAPPQTSLLDTSARFPTLPTEAVQLTPVRESHVALSSGIKNVPSTSTSQNGVHANLSVGNSASPDPKKLIKASGQPPTDPKSKRRRKVAVPEEKAPVALQQSLSEPVNLPAPVTGTHSVAVTTTTHSNLLAKSTPEKLNLAMTPAVTNDLLKAADKNTKKSALSEEALGKLKESRQQAEDAAALAYSAVTCSQEVWDQLEKQKNSGLVSSDEAKLASATAAITAAASVAKAAAAAANIASNAALQAKLMADEALNPSDCGEPSAHDGSFFSIDKASPIPILRGDVGMSGSSSIIVAAKEAARRRVEAASAAALQAKNLDAIVKAAELAAEAISQAGKIVAMGDPLPLSKLVEAGQLGIWNISEQTTKVHGGSEQHLGVENVIALPRKRLAGDLGSTEVQMVQHDRSASGEKSGNLREDPGGCADGVSGSVASGEIRSQEGLTVTDFATATEVHKKAIESKNNDGIREGNHVEVFKDSDGNKSAWFSAEVISLKDGKAYVCYSELKSGEGRLKEWVELRSEGNIAPKLRIAHPMTATHFEGTKKRRRAAMGYLSCSVGDKVDVWMQDSWCEGVVTEKGKKDETTVTVFFPARGETSVIKAWHLRPSLVWKDGEWVEWASTRQHSDLSHEGDTPREKRPKLGSAAGTGQKKDMAPQIVDVASEKPVEPKLLDLPANERTFNIGKSSTDEGRDTSRVMRAGLRKEGSGVIFGVPKPGKKRKFMEVSKHYVDDKTTKVEVNDSVKLANYLMPRGTGPRRLRNSSKTDMKEKQTAESKSKIPTFGKPRGVPSRKTNQESSLPTRVSGDSRKDHAGKSKDSSVNAENPPGKHSVTGFGSFSGSQGAEGPFLFSSLALASDTTSSKRMASSTAKDDKRKPASGTGKVSKNEDKGPNNNNRTKPAVSETVEPRRSNRRIQPTSRLLEGLQSSLIVSKIPSVSHDRGHRSLNRSSNKG